MTKSIFARLALFALVSVASRAVASEPAKLAFPQGVLSDYGGRIEQVVVQAPARELETLLPTLLTLLPQLQPYTRVELMCGCEQDQERVRGILRALGLPRSQRIRVHICPEVETLWARDRFVALRRADQNVTLLIPRFVGREPFGDYRVPLRLAETYADLATRGVGVRLEGGDIVAGRYWVLVGATTVANVRWEYPHVSDAQLQRMLERLLGKRVIFVPHLRETTVDYTSLDYHLDMFLTAARDGSVLLADVDWGERIVAGMRQAGNAPGEWPEVRDVEYPLAAARGRVDAAHRALVRAGITVRRLPVYVVPNVESVVTYNNVLQEDTPHGPTVYLPWYNAPQLDGAAASIYHGLGYKVRPVDVRQLYPLMGTLRCTVNVIRRGPASAPRMQRPDQGSLVRFRASPPRRFPTVAP